MADTIKVEVAYALPNKQMIIPLTVEQGTTMYEAVELSGIADKFPGLDITKTPMGVFEKSEPLPKKRILKDGERVCLFRPLIVDPKESRRKRAEKAKAKKEAG